MEVVLFPSLTHTVTPYGVVDACSAVGVQLMSPVEVEIFIPEGENARQKHMGSRSGSSASAS